MKKHIERKKENHTSLTHFSLFSGIGGLDLAAEMAGFKTFGQCELDDYAIKILEKHWPNVPKWRDIRNVTGLQVAGKISEEITVLSGGFPCQPHSVAGKRLASSDERDLWGNSQESFAKLDQSGSWRKTYQGYCQVSMEGFLDEFCGTWPTWGIMRAGSVFGFPSWNGARTQKNLYCCQLH